MGMTFEAIPGFFGYYDVNEVGVVRSLARGGRPFSRSKPRVMKPFVDGGGYLRVTLRRPGKKSSDPGGRLKAGVHRLVALAHIDPFPDDDLEVAHKDGDKLNVRASNLEWITHAENCSNKEAHGTLITGDDHPNATPLSVCVEAMRLFVNRGAMQAEVAEDLGISKTRARAIGRQLTANAREAAFVVALENDDPYLGIFYLF